LPDPLEQVQQDLRFPLPVQAFGQRAVRRNADRTVPLTSADG